jgi:hypothetical protein
MMWGAEGAAGDQGRAPIGEPGDAMNPGRLKGFGEGHLRQDGGQAARQPRLPCPRGAEHQEIMLKTPT